MAASEEEGVPLGVVPSVVVADSPYSAELSWYGTSAQAVTDILTVARERPSKRMVCLLVFSPAPISIPVVMNTQRIVVMVASKLSSA